MKATIRSKAGALALGIVLVFCISANAQQATQPDAQQLRAYDQNREVFLLGTVVKFASASSAPPIGAHVILKTPSGEIDVHLGNARVLQAGHLELNPGDYVRIVGEPVALGDTSYFAARVVQKGTQAVAVRNSRGFLVAPWTPKSQAQIEALRGVR